MSTQKPFTKLQNQPIKRRPYRRPITSPPVQKGEMITAINLLDQKHNSKNHPYFVIRKPTKPSRIKNINGAPTLSTQLSAPSENKLHRIPPSQRRTIIKNSNSKVVNNNLRKQFNNIIPTSKPITLSSSLNTAKKPPIRKTKPSFLDSLTNMASSVLNPFGIGEINEPIKRIHHPRPAPQPQRIVLEPDVKSKNKLADFKPSPQQGSMLVDAFQPIFVASQSLENGFPKDAMKPLFISESRKSFVPPEPTEPELINFFK